MTPEKWEKVTEIFESASHLPAAERFQFLDECCGDDEELRGEVESLLAAQMEIGDFIENPIVGELSAVSGFPDRALRPGDVIAHYRIEQAIGSGGMGEVYRATDLKLTRQVALKVLPSLFDSDPAFLRRFRNEAMAAATLNHPNVATIYAVEEAGGKPFITMEYVGGTTLDRLTPENGLETRLFLEWFEQLADALAHAHEKGIIHRDIKPGNIMVSEDGIPKILDFGLAQMDHSLSGVASRTEITAPGQIIGTPAYMSPEQASGGEVDQRSDLFSLGTVMYEALTGRRPFRGSSQGMIVKSVIYEEPEPIATMRPDVPAMLTRMIEKCLEKSQDSRFQSMREIRSVLKEAKAASDAGVSMDSFARRFYRETATPSRLWWAATVALVVVLSFSGWYFFSKKEDRPPVNFENMTISRLSQNNSVVYAYITHDGNSVVYVQIEKDMKRSLWIRRIDDKNALQLVPPQSVEYWGGFAIEQDGSHIYYITADRTTQIGTLYRISALGGNPRKIAENVNDLGTLSPDGKSILYARYGRRVQLFAANSEDGSGETLIKEVDGIKAMFRDAQYSPDGKSIYYARLDGRDLVGDWSIVSIPAAGGQETVLMQPQRERIHEIAVLKDGSGILMNAVDSTSSFFQLFHVSTRDGKVSRITNDLNTYFGVSVDGSGRTIVSAQRQDERRIWIGNSNDYGRAQPVTADTNIYKTIEWTPAGRIVYDAIENNRAHIWISDADGSNQQQLTPNTSGDAYPAVTPDGRYILFTSDRGGIDQIWRMNIDGSNQVLLANIEGSATNPKIGPDGKTVYFRWTQKGKKVLGVVHVDGGEVSELPFFHETDWAFSPDGKRVAYLFWDTIDQRPKVRVRNVDFSGPEKVIDTASFFIFKWRYDGKALYIRERRAIEGSLSTIMEFDVETGKSREFFNTEPDQIIEFSVSPEHKRIAAIRGRLLSDGVMLSAHAKNQNSRRQ